MNEKILNVEQLIEFIKPYINTNKIFHIVTRRINPFDKTALTYTGKITELDEVKKEFTLIEYENEKSFNIHMDRIEAIGSLTIIGEEK